MLSRNITMNLKPEIIYYGLYTLNCNVKACSCRLQADRDFYTGLVFSVESLKLAYRVREETIVSRIKLTPEIFFFSYLRHLLTDWYPEV